VFETLDGSINIQASPQHLFRRMAETLGAPELTERAEYRDHADRVKNRDRLNAEIEALTRQKTSAEWIDAFAEAGVPAGPIYSVDECFADPQVRTLDMDPSVEHPELGTVRLVGQALKMSRTPQRMRSPTPELGQHVDEILGELGFDTEAIAGLRARGVV
jgi:formyl-CoA transferase